MEPASSKTLHSAHGTTDARVEFVDLEVVEEAVLCADHIEYGKKGKGGSIWTASLRVDRGRPCCAIASSKYICAYDKKVIGVECFSWPYKFLPPAIFGVYRGGSSMR
jgi:hypothetical protein